LKFYFLGDYAPNTELELEIRDEDGRVFKAETDGDLEASRAAIVFSNFPSEATHFRVIAKQKWRDAKLDKNVVWDLTLTNFIKGMAPKAPTD
jgi:hypothetical protein